MPTDLSNSEDAEGAGLKLVEESGGFETAGPAEGRPGDSDSKGRRGLPIWLFVLVLLAFVSVAGWQVQVTGELEAEVAGLEAELSRSNALLDAHRLHLSEVRVGVHEVSAQLEGLRALVDRDPTDPLE